MITMHVPLMLVIRPLETVSTLQFQFLLLQIFAPSLLVTPRTVSTLIQRIVMTTIHALLTLAILPLETAYMKERIVMTATHVPSTLAMQTLEPVFILQWFVLMSILAPKKLVIPSKDVSTLLNMI
jgi:hypothetical protein